MKWPVMKTSDVVSIFVFFFVVIRCLVMIKVLRWADLPLKDSHRISKRFTVSEPILRENKTVPNSLKILLLIFSTNKKRHGFKICYLLFIL
jgi:hypothetical protein